MIASRGTSLWDRYDGVLTQIKSEHDQRRELYLAGQADDDRLDAALDGIDDLTLDQDDHLEGRIREIVQDELE